MELKIPSPEQAKWGLRAMKTVALADGELSASELHMMECIQRIFGTTFSPEELAPIAPEDLARLKSAGASKRSARSSVGCANSRASSTVSSRRSARRS